MLLGSINHVAIAITGLRHAMEFFGPVLEFLGYTLGEVIHNPSSDADLVVSINERNGTAINIWQAKSEHAFEVYEPGLHHLAFNTETHEQIDALCERVRGLGAEILDGPGEFPYAPGGYYAFYCRGPDGLKLEFVHMPLAEQRSRKWAEL